MDAKNSSDVALRDRKSRAEKALAMIGGGESKVLAAEMNDRTVALNEAEAAAARAASVIKAQAEVEAANADVQAVLTVVPFMVRTFDPHHFSSLPKAETFADTTVDYRREHLLPALRQGGKFSQVMAEALEAAIAQDDKAAARLASAGTHDARAKDREKVARKELGVTIHRAEVFIHAHTSPGDQARNVLKRERKTDNRTPEEKYQADLAKAARRLAKRKEAEANKAKRAGKSASAPSVTPVVPAPEPVVPSLPQAANSAPGLTVVNG